MKSLPLAALLLCACTATSTSTVRRYSPAPDAPAATIEVLHLRFADAHEIARLINDVCLRANTSDTVVADARTNSIVVRTDDAKTLERVRMLANELDVEAKPAK